MFQVLLGSLLRNVLASAGGAIVAKGLLSGDQLTQVVGAAGTLASLAWSAWQKFQANKTLKASQVVKFNQ